MSPIGPFESRAVIRALAIHAHFAQVGFFIRVSGISAMSPSVKLLAQGRRLHPMPSRPPVPRFQAHSIHSLALKGSLRRHEPQRRGHVLLAGDPKLSADTRQRRGYPAGGHFKPYSKLWAVTTFFFIARVSGLVLAGGEPVLLAGIFVLDYDDFPSGAGLRAW
jgi:hypothetical protein